MAPVTYPQRRRQRCLSGLACALTGTLLAALFCARACAGTDREFHHWKSLRDQDVVRQERDFSCGLAALATLLTYYFERPVSEAKLLARLDIPDAGALADTIAARTVHAAERARLQTLQEKGVSLAILAGLARDHGLHAQGVRLRPDDLARLSMPAIAYIEPGGEPHFTLIRGVDSRGSVQVADPAWGNRRFSGPDFARLFAPAGATAGRLLLILPQGRDAGRRDWFGVDRPQPLLQPMRLGR